MPQRTPIQGLHHITAFASDPQRNIDFYTRVLGQRMIKTTVNFDDPGTYHLYYADKVGSPGTVMTFFPWPNARRGVVGNGEVAVSAYSIPREAVDYWQNRLAEFGVATAQLETRFGETVIPFRDPDGMRLELITNPEAVLPAPWHDGPIPTEYMLRGFHSVTIWVWNNGPSATLLTDIFEMSELGTEGQRTRYKGSATDVGHFVDLLERPDGQRGQMGAGSVHHVAFRTHSDEEQVEWQSLLAQNRFGVTPVCDRQYFHSIYFREPSGVLYEIATDAPGFAIDEPIETLGQSLKLPPWYEDRRADIEAVLPPILHPEAEQTAPAKG